MGFVTPARSERAKRLEWSVWEVQEGSDRELGSCRKAGMELFGTAGTGAFRSCRRAGVKNLGVAKGQEFCILELQELGVLELQNNRNYAFWSCRN